MSMEENERAEAGKAAIDAILRSLSNAKNEFIMAEFNRVLDDPVVKPYADKVMLYLYASMFLSLCAREIDKYNLAKVLGVVGVDKLDDDIVSSVFKAGVRSHIPYINAYYFLLATGNAGSEEMILKLIDALGLAPDKDRLNDVMSFLEKNPL